MSQPDRDSTEYRPALIPWKVALAIALALGGLAVLLVPIGLAGAVGGLWPAAVALVLGVLFAIVAALRALVP